jgi:tetratricopeptide (TPR) repeat protein
VERIAAAYQLFQERRYAEAETACCRILAAQTPTQMRAHASSLLCQSLMFQGRFVEAEAAADAALAVAASDPDLHNMRGVVLAKLGRNAEAAACFDQAIEHRLNSPAAQENLNAVLAELRDPSPRFSVTVITPTIGTRYLPQAIESVQAQTYPLLEHLVVADGPEHHEAVRACLPRQPRHPVHLLMLPQNTGGGGFNGHRVYGATPNLVNGRFVAFLDEDNWFEPDHIASLMARISAEGLDWAYALRRLVTVDGQFIANDDCESLGKWPKWKNPANHLVDANCYLIRRDIAIATSSLWYRTLRNEQSPDFVLCQRLLRDHPRCETNGRYTVNYRVSPTAGAQPDFFLAGNAAMRERYSGTFPWRSAGP